MAGEYRGEDAAVKENEMQWLIDQIKEEDAKLHPVIGECNIGKLPIRVFLLETYLEAMKADSALDTGVYNAIKMLVRQNVFSTTVKNGEDIEQARRKLKTAAMLDEMTRS